MKKITLLVALFVSASMGLRAACDPIDITWLKISQSDWGEMSTNNANVWSYNSSYGAFGRNYNGETGYLLTPEQDLTNAETVLLTFSHTHKFANDPSSDFSLWVTANYTGDINTSSWQQLTISPYATNNDWYFVDVSISVPTSYVGAQTVFAFKYTTGAVTSGGTWEIKNLRLSATFDCSDDDGKLKVCGQNLRNYYYNYTASSRPDYSDAQGFAKKTNAIVAGVVAINADIYAFCELEAKPIILTQLVDSINKRLGKTRYAAVADGIDYTDDGYDNHLKSGFIYRKDKVKPIGNNTAASTDPYYYGNTMRIQAFEQLENGERFVLSMNHFKAKSGSDDGDSQRQTNATHLLNALKKVSIDPDILVLGDMNCSIDETPMQMLVSAGYEEQLLRFDNSAYSYCYGTLGNLIDHAFANTSMAKQVKDAKVHHICTTCNGNSGNSSTKYSDHDPYYVILELASGSSECVDIDEIYLVTGGTDYDLSPMAQESLAGTYNWKYRSSYGATCQDKGGEDWLITPVKDMSKMVSVNVSFEHAINHGNIANMTNEMTMWVTANFDGAKDSQWHQITIPNYPDGSSWTFVPTSVNIPTEYLGKNTAIAFRYKVPSDAENAPNWEIKDLKIKASCTESPTEQGVIEVENQTPKAVMLLENGRLLIVLPNGMKYDMLGTRVE